MVDKTELGTRTEGWLFGTERQKKVYSNESEHKSGQVYWGKWTWKQWTKTFFRNFEQIQML